MFHFPVAAVAGLTDDICLKITTFQQKCKHKKPNDKKVLTNYLGLGIHL
jgi:hypothetical protein